jgi:hypothetical protein
MSSASRRCLTQQPWWIQFTTRRAKTGATSLTTGRVLAGTQPAASLHRRSVIEGVVGTTVTCAMSSVVEIHAVRLKTGTERDYDYYGPYYDHDSAPYREGTM